MVNLQNDHLDKKRQQSCVCCMITILRKRAGLDGELNTETVHEPINCHRSQY